MIRLLSFIIIFALFLAFIVLNLENRCDINLGFRNFENVPVFLSALTAFTLGMMFTLPMIFSFGIRRKKNAASRISKSAGEKKKSWDFEKNSEQTIIPPEQTAEIKKEDSPYGID